MTRALRFWRMSTRTMLVVVGVCGFVCGFCVLSWRTVWGPWPTWVRAIHSSDDYYGVTLHAARRAVEGQDPNISPEAAIPELIALLDDSKYFPQIAAITALGRAGPKAAKAVPKLVSLLRGEPSTQSFAANAIGEIVTRDSRDRDAAITALLAAGNDSFPQTPAYALVRLHVIQALCRIVGPEDSRQPDLANLLTRLLADKNGMVRATAALRLIGFGQNDLSKPVLTEFRSGDEGYQTAQLGLGLLGSKTADAIAALRMARQISTAPWMKRAAAATFEP
jgi:HEAT repeat protein